MRTHRVIVVAIAPAPASEMYCGAVNWASIAETISANPAEVRALSLKRCASDGDSADSRVKLRFE